MDRYQPLNDCRARKLLAPCVLFLRLRCYVKITHIGLSPQELLAREEVAYND